MKSCLSTSLHVCVCEYLPWFVGLVYTAEVLSFTVLPVSLFPVYLAIVCFTEERCVREMNVIIP